MSISMDKLLNLPVSLPCDILNNWLILREIVKLDSACCDSGLRPMFLRILSSRQFMQRKSIKVSQSKELAWIVKRNIRLYAINIDAKLQVSEKLYDYFELRGKDLRKVNFNYDASGDMFLIPLHCRNLVSVSFCVTNIGPIIRDVLSNNPSLEEVAFETIVIMPYMLRHLALPRLRTLYCTDKFDIQKDMCESLSLLNDGVARLCLSNLDFSTPDIILSFTMRFKALRTLDLSHTTANCIIVTSVVQTCPHIVNLKLYRCVKMSDKTMLIIAQNLHELRTLDIRGCEALTDNSLVHLTEYCAARMVMLYINITDLSMDIVAALLKKCTRLHTLGLELFDPYRLVVDDNLHDLFNALSHVTQLQLRGSGLIANDILVLVGKCCHNLMHLELRPIDEPEDEEEQNTYVTAKGVFALKIGCTKIRRLVVYEQCSLLQNELAILMWQEARAELTITSNGSLDYDAMQCEIYYNRSSLVVVSNIVKFL